MMPDAPTVLVTILSFGIAARFFERHPELAVAALIVATVLVAAVVGIMSSGGHIPL